MPTLRAIVSVTNDLVTDQRVHRTCTALQQLGYNVVLVGRLRKGSPPIERSYRTVRLRLLFHKGPLFYAEFNLRLFFWLLVRPCALAVANDLDTLLANHLAARLRGHALVYDSHEFFTEVPEIAHRPNVRRVWLALERSIFPKLRTAITVNASIAKAYQDRYGMSVHVVRNIPMPRVLGPKPTREAMGLPPDSTVLVLQGAGINVQRGAEEAVLAMAELPHCLLLVIGGGDAWPTLQGLVQEHGLQQRVRLLGRMSYERMMDHTRNADIGLTLDKDTNLNYRYSLPNKLFDYLAAGLAVVASDLPEVASIVRTHQAGQVLPAVTPAAIAEAVNALCTDPQLLATLRRNATFAAAALDGKAEMERLKAVLNGIC
jgi:glycosyltransferase involved in cell wall biosynthesis